jgi:hypothetical protein
MKHLKLALIFRLFLVASLMQSFVAIAQDNTQSVKVISINPEVTITDKGVYASGKSWENQKKIGNQIMYQTPSNFTILNNISLNTLWSKLNTDKNCKYSHRAFARDFDDVSGDFSFICDVENSRTKYEFAHYTKTNFISLSRILYTTCSNGNWEEISESLISKFSQSNGLTQIEVKRGDGRFRDVTFENKSLRESLYAKLGNLAENDPFNCPGRVALQLTLQIDNPSGRTSRLSRPFTERVKRVVNESNTKDASVSVPKF